MIGLPETQSSYLGLIRGVPRVLPDSLGLPGLRKVQVRAEAKVEERRQSAGSECVLTNKRAKLGLMHAGYNARRAQRVTALLTIRHIPTHTPLTTQQPTPFLNVSLNPNLNLP